ncbi:hypothetical protein VZ94_01575 [Methylocucumis oryzae]|uniref:Uncharacterized protein n=1 Tax=Methylocucumis oryzae TaxID=1632867 RepID=A0A0F3IQM7_9GAMM|nr:hypothetical protein VZ94_01575 [Methylocucumis oryzae]
MLFDELGALTADLTERQPSINWQALMATEIEPARRYQQWVLGLITMLKTWLSTPSDGLRLVQVLVKTETGGIEWGLVGLLLSIVKEYSGLSVQMIGLDRIPSHDELIELVQANAMCADAVKVSYSQNRRFTQTWQKLNNPVTPVPLPWRQKRRVFNHRWFRRLGDDFC